MAFMMPVMKNNYDIYKDSRSRKTSECSNASSTSGGCGPTLAAAIGSAPARSGARKSESFASSPSHVYRMQMQRCQSSRAFPRNSSRSSHSSAAGALSPTRSFSQASSPPKMNQHYSSNNNNNGSSKSKQQNEQNNTQNDMSKFHLRLVDKLRKSFRKDSAKRS